VARRRARHPRVRRPSPLAPDLKTFAQRYGPWAVIAGASEGIGAAFARAIARRGVNLVLIARRKEPLDLLASELRETHVEARTLPLDLGPSTMADEVAEATVELDVGLLVCSAAVSLMAPFTELAFPDVQRTLDVNVRAPLALCHHFAPRLLQRGRGGIVLMSSVAGLTASPFAASYAGSKAFALAFGESLWGELTPHGIDVLTCVAGPTKTPTYAQVQTSDFPRPMDAGTVAESALAALGKRPRVVPGWANRLAASWVPRLPRRFGIRLIAGQTAKYQRRLK
jgi:short-subunit dehydrogenase